MHATIDIGQHAGEPAPEKKSKPPKRYRWLWRSLLLLLVLISLPIVLWLSLPLYWQAINPLLRQTAGVSLSIESLNTGFDGINPFISLKNARLYSDRSDQTQKDSPSSVWYPKTINQNASAPTALLSVNQASITVALRSLPSLKPVLKQANVDQLTIHGWQDPEHYYWIAGFKIKPSQDSTPIDWLWIRQQQAQITHAQLIWHSAASTAMPLPMTLVDIPVLSVIKTAQGHEVDARIIPNKHLGEPIEIKGSLAHSTQILNGQGHLAIPLVQIRHISDLFFLPDNATHALELIDTVSVQGNLSWTPSSASNTTNASNTSQLSANLNTVIKPHAFESSKQFNITALASAKHQGVQSILQIANIQAQFNNWLSASASISQPTDKPEYDLDLTIPAIYLDRLMDELGDFGLLKSLPPELQTKQWIGEIENIKAHVSGLSLKHQLEYQTASAALFIQSAGWKEPIVTGALNLQAKPITLKNKPTTTHQLSLVWNLETLGLPALGLTLTQLLKGTGKEWAEKAFKAGELNHIKGDVAFTFDEKTKQISDLRAQTQAQVKQLGLNYWSTYPAVDQADGLLNLTYNPKTKTHDAKLEVKSGKILDYQLAPSTVDFLSIEKNSLLQIKANAAGDTSHLFSFVQQAPLPAFIKQATEGLSGSGSSSLQFQMDLPINNASAQLAISVHASFADTTFNHTQWGAFTVSGDAGWAGGKIYSLSGLSAKSDLGQVNIDSFDASKRSVLRARGHFIYGEILDLLAKQGQNTDQIRYILKGEDQSKIGFDLESQAQIDVWFNNRLNVDLSELSIDIPTLVAKPSKAPLNLSLSTQQNRVKASSSASVLMSIKLAQPNQSPILDIGYELDKRDLKLVRSGHISIGRAFLQTEQNSLFNASKNTINTSLTPIESTIDATEIVHTVIADVFSPEFDLDQLRQWVSRIPTNKEKEESPKPFHPDQLHVWANTLDTSIDKIKPYLGFIPTKWNINTSNLIYQKNKTGPLNIEVATSPKHAKMQVQHKNIDGFLEWRNNPDKQTILGRFQRLALTTQSTTQVIDTKTNPKKTTTTDKNAKAKTGETEDISGLEKTKQAIKPWQDELLRWSAQPVIDADLDIEVSQVLIGKNDLGSFAIKGHAFKPEVGRELVGFVFDEISLNGDKTQLNINGHWYHQPKKVPSVQLSINVQSSDFGEFLSAIGQPKILKDGQTQLQFVAGWDKHIAQIDFDTLSGNLNFNVQNGFILPIDSTALRLLGLLSFQNITKIFDVFKKSSQDGFAFDQLAGQAKVTRGIMKLESVKLASPPLDATITGDIDLKQETQNLHLLVKPKVDVGSFSTLYALLINPIVGLGTLALGLFANKAFTIDYQVTGTFEKPVLQKN